MATLEALSTLAGEEELLVRTASRPVGSAGGQPLGDLLSGGRPQFGESVSTQWRRRLPPDVITRGDAGHLLAFDTRNQPGWVPWPRPTPSNRGGACADSLMSGGTVTSRTRTSPISRLAAGVTGPRLGSGAKGHPADRR